jgi:hypothetical protein
MQCYPWLPAWFCHVRQQQFLNDPAGGTWRKTFTASRLGCWPVLGKHANLEHGAMSEEVANRTDYAM